MKYKPFKVTIYPVTPWTVKVHARNKTEAKKKALALDGPAFYDFADGDEWVHDIMEWPNIGTHAQIDVELEE